MTDNEKDNDGRDDVDWLRDAFDRAIQGDNGTVSDASRPAVNPFAGLTPSSEQPVSEPDNAPIEPVAPVTPPAPVADSSHRNDLDLDFETENLPPVTAFEPVVPLERPLPAVATDYPPTEALDAIDIPAPTQPEPTVPVETIAPVAPTAAAPTGDTTGIDQLDALFSASETPAAVPLLEAPRRGSKRGDNTAESAEKPAKTPLDQAALRQRLILVIGGIVVAIVAIGAWIAGVVVATPAAAPTPTETAAPAAPTAIQPPGEYAFGDLFGGECLEPFDTAWASNFTVVDCAEPHTAQLVYAGDLAADGMFLSYPGDSHIGKAATELCSRKGVLDLTAAKVYTDLQISTAYPPSVEAWDLGDTRYYCFATLASGSAIEGDLAGKLISPAVEPTPEPTSND